MFVGLEAIPLCPVWLYFNGLQVWWYYISKIIFCYHITALSDSCTKKKPFLQQACHRMILQIVETGFPAKSDTSTQHTCCQLPVYVFRRSRSFVHCVLFHLITEQLLSRSVEHLESWYIWLDRRGTGGWGLEGEVRSSSNPPWGSALQLPQLEKGLDRLISGTVQLSQLGTQLFFLISVKIRCTFPKKQESWQLWTD